MSDRLRVIESSVQRLEATRSIVSPTYYPPTLSEDLEAIGYAIFSGPIPTEVREGELHA